MTKKLAQALVIASLSAGASGTVPSAADAFIKAAMAESPPAGSGQASGILVTSRLSPQMSQLAPSSDPSITQILLEIKSHVSQNSGGRAQVAENQIDYFLARDKGQPYTVAKKLYWDLFDIAVIALDSDEIKKDLKAAEAAGVKAILPRAIRVRFFMGYQTSAALQSFHTWSAMFEPPKVYYNNELLNSGCRSLSIIGPCAARTRRRIKYRERSYLDQVHAGEWNPPRLARPYSGIFRWATNPSSLLCSNRAVLRES